MIQNLAVKRDTTRRLDASMVRVGKDIVELVTSGMYLSPITIYREYVQNSADAIEAAVAEGLIDAGDGAASISIDHARRSVVIADNGAGIRSEDVPFVLLAIGGSTKRGTNARGFRGVGRLSGLAYCKSLRFRTRSSGEDVVSIVEWDCRLLRRRLAEDGSSLDIHAVVAASATLECVQATEDDPSHFFEVTMLDVARHKGDILLNEATIRSYLSQVAPVRFSDDFGFADAIVSKLAGYGVAVGVLELKLQGEPVLRPYADRMTFAGNLFRLDLSDVEFMEFADVDGEPGAIGWIAHHQYARSIQPNLGIGRIRARIGDVQVGEGSVFDEVFKEPRFNGWCVGELHILDRRIRPNARRDNFELNHHAYNMLAQLGPTAIELSQRCRSSSVARNVLLTAQNFLGECARAFADGAPPLDGGTVSRLRSSVDRSLWRLRGIEVSAERDRFVEALEREKRRLEGVRSAASAVVDVGETTALVRRLVTNREQAERLIAALNAIAG